MLPAGSQLLMACLVTICAFMVLSPTGAAAVVIVIGDSSPWVSPLQTNSSTGPTDVFQWQNNSQGTHRIVVFFPPDLPTTGPFLFDTDLLLPTLTSTPVTLTTGNYRYICLIHPYISGSIRVGVSGPPPPPPTPFTTPDIFQSVDTPSLGTSAPPGVGEICVSQQFETPIFFGISGVVHCADAHSFQDLSLAAFSGNPAASIRVLTAADTTTASLIGRQIGGRFEDLNNTHGLWYDKTGKKMFVAEWHGGQFHTVDRMTNTIAQTTPVFTGADVAHIITSLPGQDAGFLSLEGGASGKLGVFDPATSTITQFFDFGPVHHPHGLWLTCPGGGNGGGILIAASPMSNEVSFVDAPQTPTGPVSLRGVTTTPGLYPFHVGAMASLCAGAKAYLPNSFSNTIGVFDVLSGNALPPVVLPPCPSCQYLGAPEPLLPVPVDVAVSPDNLCAVVTLSKGGQVVGIDTATDTVALPAMDCGNGCHGVTFGKRVGGGFHWYASNTYQNKIKVGEVVPGCGAWPVADILLNVSSILPLQGLNTSGTGFNTALPPPNRGGGTGIVSFPLPPPWHPNINVLQ